MPKLVINPIASPCKDCENRVLGCHSVCSAYFDYRQKLNKYNEQDRQERMDRYEKLQSYYSETYEHRWK